MTLGDDAKMKINEENLVDYHLHTEFSDDSIMNLENLIRAAKDKNVKKICITDHVEPHEIKGGFEGEGETLKIKTEKYLAKIKEVIEKETKMDMEKPGLCITRGVELGLSPDTLKKSSQYVSLYPFDYVLASIHEIGGVDVNEKGLHEEKDGEELIFQFLEETYRCIKDFDEFDSLGHLDLIRRYIKRYKGVNDIIYTSNHKPIIDDILKLIIQRGKGIEVNSSGYRYGLMGPMPSFEIIKRYGELGGEIITMGSDAHEEAFVGDKLLNIREILLEAGFSYVFSFENRKPMAHKLI